MNAPTPEDLSFYGRDDEDVTAFFQALLRAARAAGHQRDNDWLVDTLEVSLAGAALQFYVNLDDGSRGDFNSARQAMINRFGRAFYPPNPAAVPAAPPVQLAVPPPSQYTMTGEDGLLSTLTNSSASPSLPWQSPLLAAPDLVWGVNTM